MCYMDGMPLTDQADQCRILHQNIHNASTL